MIDITTAGSPYKQYAGAMQRQTVRVDLEITFPGFPGDKEMLRQNVFGFFLRLWDNREIFAFSITGQGIKHNLRCYIESVQEPDHWTESGRLLIRMTAVDGSTAVGLRNIDFELAALRAIIGEQAFKWEVKIEHE